MKRYIDQSINEWLYTISYLKQKAELKQLNNNG